MKSPQILLLLATLLSTEARSPKSSLISLPRKHAAQRKHHAFIDKSTVAAHHDAARTVRGGGGGEATMTNEMFNMVKAVVGVGVLSLPAGEWSDTCIYFTFDMLMGVNLNLNHDH